MHAVSTSDSRTVGQTSFDFVAAFFFGKQTLTARGLAGSKDWLAPSHHVRDRLPQYPTPQASGHGHRP